MAITTLSSRQFNQDASKAKKAAKAGPVFITDRGRPAHVLLTFDEYQRITRGHAKIADLLAMPGLGPAGGTTGTAGTDGRRVPHIEGGRYPEGVELELPPLRDLAQPADLS